MGAKRGLRDDYYSAAEVSRQFAEGSRAGQVCPPRGCEAQSFRASEESSSKRRKTDGHACPLPLFATLRVTIWAVSTYKKLVGYLRLRVVHFVFPSERYATYVSKYEK